MKKMKRIVASLLMAVMTLGMLAGCNGDGGASTGGGDGGGNTGGDGGSDKIKVGFIQLGAESGWRDAETESIKETAESMKDEIDFTFIDAQNSQENQIKAIRDFIQQGMDVIGLAPETETGWDQVFKEAQDAGIPIVLVDRTAKVDDDLYATFIGSDFVEEGKNAAIELSKLLGGEGKVVQLEGTVGASAANDRKKGFDDEIAANHPGIEIIDSQSGDFERAKAKPIMESFLKSYSGEIDAVYAHNDDMALAAITAIEDEGLKPGEDIKIVSVDGIKEIFEAVVDGKSNIIVECNPLLGPQFFKACKDIVAGVDVEKWIKSDEDVFVGKDACEEALPNRKY